MVLYVVTNDHQTELTTEQSARGEELTLYDLKRVMNQHYHQLNRGRNSRKDDTGEVLLTAINSTCYGCRKKGHTANICPNCEGNKNDRNQN
jgi:hypothetical protein